MTEGKPFTSVNGSGIGLHLIYMLALVVVWPIEIDAL